MPVYAVWKAALWTVISCSSALHTHTYTFKQPENRWHCKLHTSHVSTLTADRRVWLIVGSDWFCSRSARRHTCIVAAQWWKCVCMWGHVTIMSSLWNLDMNISDHLGLTLIGYTWWFRNKCNSVLGHLFACVWAMVCLGAPHCLTMWPNTTSWALR